MFILGSLWPFHLHTICWENDNFLPVYYSRPVYCSRQPLGTLTGIHAHGICFVNLTHYAPWFNTRPPTFNQGESSICLFIHRCVQTERQKIDLGSFWLQSCCFLGVTGAESMFCSETVSTYLLSANGIAAILYVLFQTHKIKQFNRRSSC